MTTLTKIQIVIFSFLGIVIALLVRHNFNHPERIRASRGEVETMIRDRVRPECLR